MKNSLKPVIDNKASDQQRELQQRVERMEALYVCTQPSVDKVLEKMLSETKVENFSQIVTEALP